MAVAYLMVYVIILNMKRLAVFKTISIGILLIFCLGCAKPIALDIVIPDRPPEPPKIGKVNIALVLGSGGFRGGAHIGVLEVLEEQGVPIDLIVGSSAGGFVGALYADDPNISSLKEKLISITSDKILDPSWIAALRIPFYPTGIVKGNALRSFLDSRLTAKNFRDLKIPLVIVATNVSNNKVTLLRSGPLIPAIHASSAMPPLFAPVALYKNLFLDGGFVAPVPVSVAKAFDPELIIAVDISKPPSLARVKNTFELTNRALDISFYNLAKVQAEKADIVISPDLTGFGTFDDEYIYDYYLEGRRAAIAVLGEIKEKISKL
jgi:NTE family protein